MEQSKGVLGEVRRVHVVYFLCRNGKIEQPHLIRVHHLHRNGVHLRDVKRWLSELRGKDMPETFAWSYKRRYKTGYVWQDLMDDDLITPISDNEYVLKGSDILRNDNLPFELFSCIGGEETPERNPNLGALEGEAKPAKPESPPATEIPPETLQIEREDNTSPQPPPRLDEESPPTTGSKPLGGSSKQAAVFKIDVWRQNRQGSKKREELEAECGERRRSYSSGSGRRSSNVFRNLLGCRPMEAADSVQQPIQRPERDRLAGRDISNRSWPQRRSFDGTVTHRPKSQNTDPSSSSSNINININRKGRSMNGGKNSRKSGDRATSVIYKPVGKPNCSQCGKAFRPDRLHSHMKSCKALRKVWKV